MRLSPTELGDLWRYVKPMIFAGMPPGTEASEKIASQVQRTLLKGDMWCWIVMAHTTPVGAVTAYVDQDFCTEVRRLTVYSAWFEKVPSVKVIKSLYGSMLGLAKVQGCTRLAGFTTSKQVVDIASKLKGSRPSIYLEVDVK